MAFPFVLAGLILYYLIKFCLRKLIMRQSNMIEENESKPTTTDPNDEIRTDVKLSDPEYVV